MSRSTTRDFYREIGSRIKDLRKARRLSQQDLAVAIGISRPTMVNIEAGRQQIYLHLAGPIAAALNITLSELTSSVFALSPCPIDQVQIPAAMVSAALMCAGRAEDIMSELRAQLTSIRSCQTQRAKMKPAGASLLAHRDDKLENAP